MQGNEDLNKIKKKKVTDQVRGNQKM